MVSSSGQDHICLCSICSFLVFLAAKDGLFDIIMCCYNVTLYVFTRVFYDKQACCGGGFLVSYSSAGGP